MKRPCDACGSNKKVRRYSKKQLLGKTQSKHHEPVKKGFFDKLKRTTEKKSGLIDTLQEKHGFTKKSCVCEQCASQHFSS